MIIFIIIPWFNPAYKAGGPVQSISNMVDQYKKEIQYKIFTSNADLDNSISNVKPDEWVKYNEYTEVWYASKKKQTLSILKEQIKATAPNVLFINGIYSWYFNMMPLLFCKAGRKIISVRGMLHPGALSQKKMKKKIYLGIWKTLGLHRNCEFHASVEDEKIFIQHTFGENIRVFVAPNFPRFFLKQLSPKKKMEVLRLATIALISPMKNHLLVLQALEICHDIIYYDIYGPVKDDNYWQTCLRQIARLPKNIMVTFHGDIEPSKVESSLQNCHVFILPSKSENFGHALFEALSAGKPVITSHKTPWQNLSQYKAGVNVDTSDTKALRDAIHFFASMDDAEISEWSDGAKNYSRDALNVESITQQYNDMFF